MTILVPRMALLEGPPVITEDLLEGVFVDPLPGGCHSAGLYHVFTPSATWLGTLLRPSLPIVFPCRDGQKGGFSKRKVLDATFTSKPRTRPRFLRSLLRSRIGSTKPRYLSHEHLSRGHGSHSYFSMCQLCTKGMVWS